MTCFRIDDVKQFMAKLLTGETFDGFLVKELELSVAYRVSIDCRRCKQYYNSEEWEALQQKEYLLWQELRQIVYQMVKGTHTPLSFRIVLAVTKDAYPAVVGQDNALAEISALYLNLHFEHKELTVCTAVGMNGFLPKREQEEKMSAYVQHFLQQQMIAFEKI